MRNGVRDRSESVSHSVSVERKGERYGVRVRGME